MPRDCRNNMPKKIKPGYYVLAIFIALTLLILAESLLPGDVSAAQSGSVSGAIGNLPGIDKDEIAGGTEEELGDQYGEAFAVNFNYIIRKILGHFILFAALGVFAALTFYMFRGASAHNLWAVPLTGLGIAALSEIFQLPFFTSGRVANIDDVILDFIGYATGAGIVALIVFIRNKKHKKTASVDDADRGGC